MREYERICSAVPRVTGPCQAPMLGYLGFIHAAHAISADCSMVRLRLRLPLRAQRTDFHFSAGCGPRRLRWSPMSGPAARYPACSASRQ